MSRIILTKHEFRQLRHLGYALDGLRDLCEENSNESVKRVASVLEPIHSEFAAILYKIECENGPELHTEGGAHGS